MTLVSSLPRETAFLGIVPPLIFLLTLTSAAALIGTSWLLFRFFDTKRAKTRVISRFRNYQPIAPSELATDDMRKLVSMTRAVSDSYVAARFADCIAATNELERTFGDTSQGKLCALYRRLSMEYLDQPLKDFRGQIKLESE